MPPVNSASTSDVDNEATAELPVLDVAAYESTLAEGLDDHNAHTDSWAVSTAVLTPATVPAIEATTEMPAIKLDKIPTLVVTTPAYDIDRSGTHEMPAMPRVVKSRRKVHEDPAPNNPVSAVPVAVPDPAPAPAVTPAPTIVIPPSPPLIDELRKALAEAQRRIQELDERARIADAERSVAMARANAECAQLRAQLAEHLEAAGTARGRLAVQAADHAGIEDECFARGDRIAALNRDMAAQAATLEQVRASLAASEQRCERLDCDAMNLRATVARREAQIAMLEADMAARQQRESTLSARLGETLACVDPNVPELRNEISRRDAEVRELRSELQLARSLEREKDADLQVAEESIRNLESELRTKSSKLEEASVTVDEWRAVIAESQRSILQRDSRIQQLESDLQKRAVVAAPVPTDQTGEEIALEGPARVLIRTDGNTDFVHVLGRRTRIGRGSDNELVLDTKHVSRYHAVLLAGPVHTSIEDLNSTNGVYVNGRRITRQVLKDGDRVAIGRTQFRYTVRD